MRLLSRSKRSLADLTVNSQAEVVISLSRIVSTPDQYIVQAVHYLAYLQPWAIVFGCATAAAKAPTLPPFNCNPCYCMAAPTSLFVVCQRKFAFCFKSDDTPTERAGNEGLPLTLPLLMYVIRFRFNVSLLQAKSVSSPYKIGQVTADYSYFKIKLQLLLHYL